MIFEIQIHNSYFIYLKRFFKVIVFFMCKVESRVQIIINLYHISQIKKLIKYIVLLIANCTDKTVSIYIKINPFIS